MWLKFASETRTKHRYIRYKKGQIKNKLMVTMKGTRLQIHRQNEFSSAAARFGRKRPGANG